MKILCRYRRAIAYYEIGRYSECVEDLQYVLQKDPNSVPPRILLGRAYKMRAELSKAEDELNHAVILQNSEYSVYIERGITIQFILNYLKTIRSLSLGDIRFRCKKNPKTISAIDGVIITIAVILFLY